MSFSCVHSLTFTLSNLGRRLPHPLAEDLGEMEIVLIPYKLTNLSNAQISLQEKLACIVYPFFRDIVSER